jgi:U11/U12 small nuclear ribonucleoprotein SNRNP35
MSVQFAYVLSVGSDEPSPLVEGRPEATVFVARLSHSTAEDDLMKEFSKFGTVLTCRVVRDIVTGRSKGYAFIEYKHSGCAEDAYHGANKMVIDGKEIIVDYEIQRTIEGWVPRRLGGGLGGKKESGQLRFGGRDRPFRRPIQLDSNLLGDQYSKR